MATLPTILQKKIVKDSYTWTPQVGFIRTEMEVGPVRQRRRASAMPTSFSFRMILGGQELAIFEAWYKHKIDGGAAWFIMPVSRGGAMDYTDVRFTEAYTVSISGYDMFDVSCNAEIREKPVMDESELEQHLD